MVGLSNYPNPEKSFEANAMNSMSQSIQDILTADGFENSILNSKEEFIYDFLEKSGDSSDFFGNYLAQGKKIYWNFLKFSNFDAFFLIKNCTRLSKKPFELDANILKSLSNLFYAKIATKFPDIKKKIDDFVLSKTISVDELFLPSFVIDFYDIIDLYVSELAISDPKKLDTLKKDLIQISINNQEIIDDLNSKGIIDTAKYDIITGKSSEDRPAADRQQFESLFKHQSANKFKNYLFVRSFIKSLGEESFKGLSYDKLFSVDNMPSDNDIISLNPDLDEAIKNGDQNLILKEWMRGYSIFLKNNGYDDISEIVDSVINNNMEINFFNLNDDVKNKLVDTMKKSLLNKGSFNDFLKVSGLLEKENALKYQELIQFVDSLFDMNSDSIDVKIRKGKQLKLKIKNKGFLNYSREINDKTDLFDDSLLPFKITFDLDDRDTFQYLVSSNLLQNKILKYIDGGKHKPLKDRWGKFVTNQTRISYKVDGLQYEGYPEIVGPNIVLYSSNGYGDETRVPKQGSILPIGKLSLSDLKVEENEIMLFGDEINALVFNQSLFSIDDFDKHAADYDQVVVNYGNQIQDFDRKPSLQNESKNDQNINSSEFIKKRLLDYWNSIGGYNFGKDKKFSNSPDDLFNTYGFVKGSSVVFNADLISTGIKLAPFANNKMFKFEILDVDADNNKVKLNLTDIDSKGLGKNIDLSFEHFESVLKGFSAGITYKFPPKTKVPIKTFFDSAILSFNHDEFKNVFNVIGSFDRSGSYPKRLDGKEVKFFGNITEKEDKEKNANIISGVAYAVEIKNDMVDVTIYDMKNKKYLDTKSMTPGEFLLFVSDRGLSAYSEDEFSNKIKESKPVSEKGGLGLKWYSINSYSKFLSKIKSGVKKYFDDKYAKDDKELSFYLHQKLIDKGVFKVLSKIPFVGGAFDDIKDGFESGRDFDIFNIITEKREDYKKRGGVDSGKVSGEILDLLEGGKEEKIYNMCGAMLFAMDSGGLYLRKMGSKAGSGIWIKAMLGEEHHKKYLENVENLFGVARNKSPNDINSDEDIQKMVGYEVQYMLNVLDNNPELREKKFSNKFRGELEGVYRGMFSKENIEKTYVEEESYKSYDRAYGNFFSFMKQNRVQKGIGALKAVIKLSNSSEEVVKSHEAFLIGLTSGVFSYSANIQNKEYIEQMARSIGFPIGYYVKDPQCNMKVANIISNIAKELNIEDDFSKVWLSANHRPDTYGANLENYIKNFQARWKKDGNGKKISDFISMKNVRSEDGNVHNLLKYSSSNPLISDFVGKSAEEKDDNSFDQDLNSRTFYQNNPFQVSKSVVARQMLNYAPNIGERVGTTKDISNKFWGIVSTDLKNSSSASSDDPSEFKFKSKKIISWLGQKIYTPKSMPWVIQFLYLAQKEAKLGNKRKSDDYLNYATTYLAQSTGMLPIVFEDMLANFGSFIRGNLKKIDVNYIEYVFGSEGRQYFRDVGSNEDAINKYKKNIDQSRARKGGILELFSSNQNSAMGGYDDFFNDSSYYYDSAA